MQPFIMQLMNEHRFIEQALDALTAHTQTEAPWREDTGAFVEFFRNYADTIHHGKEEAILFRELERSGLQRDSGPLAVMLFEHGEGRRAVTALAGDARGPGAHAAESLSLLRETADGFAELLRNHILKEDRILYPLAMRTLPGEVLAQLESETRAFDAEAGAPGKLAHYERLGRDLIIRHPVKCATVANWTCNVYCHA